MLEGKGVVKAIVSKRITKMFIILKITLAELRESSALGILLPGINL